MDDHDRGLAFDLSTLSRRGLLGLFGAGLAAACAPNPTTPAPTATPTSGAASAASCDPIPEETAGPYPGDGSNGPNALAQDGIVRSDIRSSFGGATGTAEGVPLRIELVLTDASAGCGPLRGAALYLWHCDREGRYSMYDGAIRGENHLRGVQVSDDAGRIAFTTIFPAAYSGRWPHAHFEVYRSLADATGGGEPLVTSQLALPQDVCDTVYATPGYEASVRNMARTSLERDMVFRDGHDQQVAAVSGDVATGYTARLTVGVPT